MVEGCHAMSSAALAGLMVDDHPREEDPWHG